MNEKNQYNEILFSVKENNRLINENNQLIKNQDQREKRRIIFKLIWFAVLIGLPFILYYFIYNIFFGGLNGNKSPLDSMEDGINQNTIQQLLQIYGGQ